MDALSTFYQNLDQELLIRALTVTGIELVTLIVAYFVVSFILGFLQKRLHAVPSLEKIADKVSTGIRLLRTLLRLFLVIGLFGALGVNGYQLFQGVDVQQFTLAQIDKIPPGFWLSLVISFAKVSGLVIAARYLIRWLNQGLAVLKEKAVNYKQLRSNDESVARVFDRLMQIQKVVVWLLVAYVATRLFSAPEFVSGYILIALKVYLIISFGLLVVNTTSAIVDSLDGLSKRYAESSGLLGYYDQLSGLVPLLRKTLEYIVYAATATLVLSQLSFISGLARFGPGVIQGIGVIFWRA